MAGRAVKEFEEYLIDGAGCHVGHDEYLEAPATALLRYLVEAKSAIDLCVRYLLKRDNGQYTQASEDTLQHLAIASLPAIMGHFETYQRYLFGGMFDLSVHLANFDSAKFFRALAKATNIESIGINWRLTGQPERGL